MRNCFYTYSVSFKFHLYKTQDVIQNMEITSSEAIFIYFIIIFYNSEKLLTKN